MAQNSNSILVRSIFILQLNKISKASKYLILGIFGFEMLKFWVLRCFLLHFKKESRSGNATGSVFLKSISRELLLWSKQLSDLFNPISCTCDQAQNHQG